MISSCISTQCRTGPGSRALREAAAVEPAQVQLLPLRHRPLRPHGAAHRDRAHRIHLIHREGPGDSHILFEISCDRNALGEIVKALLLI